MIHHEAHKQRFPVGVVRDRETLKPGGPLHVEVAADSDDRVARLRMLLTAGHPAQIVARFAGASG